MNKFLTITMSALSLSLLASCGDAPDVGVIGGADGPTSIYISDSKDNADNAIDKDKENTPTNLEENQNDK